MTLGTFFALTYALTWATFITVAARVPANTPAGYGLVLLGVFAPAIVSLALTGRTAGREGVAALLQPIGVVDVGLRWYVFAAVFMALVKLAAAGLHRTCTGAWPAFGAEPFYVQLLATAVSTPFQAGEEIGWRGYALPRLAQRFGAGAASVLLGVIWAVWHLPQFYIAQADTYHQSFLVWAPQVVAMSVVLAWVYARTGSLLLAMLTHSAINNTKDIVPSAQAIPPGVFSLHASLISWLTLGILWTCAAYFLVRMPKHARWVDP